LLTHMVCADQQIHTKELRYLHKLEQQIGIDQSTREEKEKILAQDEYLIPVDVVAQRVPRQQHNQAMEQILVMAYIDGFYSPLERYMVERIGQIWSWSSEKIQGFEESAQACTTAQPIPDGSPAGNSLWNDRDYKAAIHRFTEIAQEDFPFTESALQAAETTLDNLKTSIGHSLDAIQHKTNGNARAETAKEVVKQLETTKQSLEVEIAEKVKVVCKSLSAKQRALNYFSIAFMGKTKAGKSTLHAIMTGEGWDAIGVGKQRTTRLNRVYEWENIRIIDTPGIGAPGGKTDEEIALSVINEADVICYVVTNDSIQETEFCFLRLLKENAKSLIILLNVKNNLRDSRRLEHFLKDSNKLFAVDGSSGLGGHIERIRGYAQQHYGNDYFEIIPVMLLAAQLSYESEHQHHKDQFFKGSQMQNFLDEIWLSLVEYGAIRRSQTLLGCTLGDIQIPCKWVNEQAQTYKKLTDTLKSKRDDIQNKIEKAANDAVSSLNFQIESIYQDATNEISSFAEDNWDFSVSDMKQGWEQKLKNIRFEERINTAYQEAVKTFNKQVQEAIEEVGRELQLIAQLGGGTGFSFDEQDSENFWGHAFRIGGGLLGLIGAVFVVLANPIGWAFAIVGGIAGILAVFFKSKSQKQREAVQNISNSLASQLKNQKRTTLQKAGEQFGEHCQYIKTNVDAYFEELIEGLDAIAQQLQSAQSKLEIQVNDLNRAYAKRIVNWCLKRHEPLTREGIDSTIAEVERDFGHRIIIKLQSFLQLQRTEKEINSVLQERISFLIPTPPPPTAPPNVSSETPKSPKSTEAKTPKNKFPGVLAIDLGTTKSVMAIIKDGQPMVLANKEGLLSTPSVVAYTQDGVCLVGQPAKRQAITNPQNTYDSVLRFICDGSQATTNAKQICYKAFWDKGNVKIDCPILGQQFTPEEILAQILRKLADDASQYLDEQVTQVELSLPAYFDDTQRLAVKEAGRLAGLEVLRIIPSPTAAAVAYGFSKQSNETILVFDLGGGHFSVSTLEVGDGVFEVLSYSGDTQLGGNDFDQKIVDWLSQEFKNIEGIDLRQNNQALQRLREAAEKAKIELSSATQTEIDLPWIVSTASGSKNLQMTLTRSKLEELCTDLIERCQVGLANALQYAHIDKNAIDEVILVGGSTRIPAVQKLVQQFFGKDPKGFNSDESVALGAAVEAGILAGAVEDILVLDVIPLSLGVETLGGVRTLIIPRNTTIPTKKSETFSTTLDGQTCVEIHIIQGEMEIANDHKSLGIFRLDGIPSAPRGVAQIEVTFDIDANGVLYVTAKDKGTGKEQSMTLTRASTLSQENASTTSDWCLGTPVAVTFNSIAPLVNPFF
jgi:chaperone protein DnaK